MKKAKVEKQALVAQVMACHFLVEETHEIRKEEQLITILGSSKHKTTYNDDSSLTYQGKYTLASNSLVFLSLFSAGILKYLIFNFLLNLSPSAPSLLGLVSPLMTVTS